MYRNPFEMPIRPLCRPFVHLFCSFGLHYFWWVQHDTNRLCQITFESSTSATWRFDTHRLVNTLDEHSFVPIIAHARPHSNNLTEVRHEVVSFFLATCLSARKFFMQSNLLIAHLCSDFLLLVKHFSGQGSVGWEERERDQTFP